MTHKFKKPLVLVIIALVCLWLIVSFLMTFGGTGEGHIERSPISGS